MKTKRLIDADQLQTLLRQVVELEAFHAPALRQGRVRPVLFRLRSASLVGLAAAAALVFALLPPWSVFAPDGAHSTRDRASGPTVSIGAPSARAANGESEFAFVLFRDWAADCRCEQWMALDLLGGLPLAHFYPTEQSDASINGLTGLPASNQQMILAVGRAPRDGDMSARIVRCLNESGACAPAEGPDHADVAALKECFTGTLVALDTVPSY